MRRVVVITGATAGVGRATGRLFAEHGWDVALLARGSAGLAAATAEIADRGQRSIAIPVDVADFAAVEAAAERVEKTLGPIDVWVNDAMTTVFAQLDEIDPPDFERAIDVTFLGQVWGTKAALARMKPRDRGTIVNVGSALAFVGIPLQSAYCAAKFACRGFFEATRAELLHEHSHVMMSMVHLPAVNTPQFEWCKTAFSRHPQPVAPIYQPEVCARAIFQVATTGRRERVLGSWNKLLVLAARALPGMTNQFASMGAWEEQLDRRPLQPGREANLYRPVDSDVDFGAHGTFDSRAKGFRTPSFLATLPKAARQLATAWIRSTREDLRISLRRRPSSMSPYGHEAAEYRPAEHQPHDESAEVAEMRR